MRGFKSVEAPEGKRGLMNEWISVKDRLPDREELVIVWAPSPNRVIPGYYLAELVEDSGCSYLWRVRHVSWNLLLRDTSHWQPLPAPPQVPDA